MSDVASTNCHFQTNFLSIVVSVQRCWRHNLPGQGWAGRGGEEITTVDKYKVLGILLSVSGSGLRVEMETKVRKVFAITKKHRS